MVTLTEFSLREFTDDIPCFDETFVTVIFDGDLMGIRSAKRAEERGGDGPAYPVVYIRNAIGRICQTNVSRTVVNYSSLATISKLSAKRKWRIF